MGIWARHGLPKGHPGKSKAEYQRYIVYKNPKPTTKAPVQDGERRVRIRAKRPDELRPHGLTFYLRAGGQVSLPQGAEFEIRTSTRGAELWVQHSLGGWTRYSLKHIREIQLPLPMDTGYCPRVGCS